MTELKRETNGYRWWFTVNLQYGTREVHRKTGIWKLSPVAQHGGSGEPFNGSPPMSLVFTAMATTERESVLNECCCGFSRSGRDIWEFSLCSASGPPSVGQRVEIAPSIFEHRVPME